jgi:hypothetical protein
LALSQLCEKLSALQQDTTHVETLIEAENQAPSNGKKCGDCGFINAMNVQYCRGRNCQSTKKLPFADEARKTAATSKRKAFADVTNTHESRRKETQKRNKPWTDETDNFNLSK